MKRGVLPVLAITVMTMAMSLVVSSAAFATFNESMADGAQAAKGVDQVADLFGPAGTFQTISNVLLFLVGAISVIMLIIGGLRYVVSGGDSTAIQGAKNTILYAIVGIVVAILAYAAVAFIIGSFSSSTGAGGISATNT